MSSKSSVFNHLPIHLRGEIIQIGAVKLNADWTPAEEFQIDVKPIYFRKMHYKVKKLTGIDNDRLDSACGFVEAFAKFRKFCGENCTFLTWGYDDKGIMEQNIIVHEQDWDWIDSWVNLQLIYNMQTEGDKNQKSLQTAMEHFAIEQTRTAHDALGDAYNTGLVCAHLDMETGLKNYADAARLLSMRRKRSAEESESGPVPMEHLTFTGFSSRNEAFSDAALTEIGCPVCEKQLSLNRWVNQGDRRYMTLGSCEEHGDYLIRVKLKYTDEETWTLNRILYEADADMAKFYQTKSVQRRKRSRRRNQKRKKS